MASPGDHNNRNLPPRKGLQGPRPQPLGVCKSSSKIKKQPPDHLQAPHRPPVIIYMKSPEVIHVDAQNFMSTVQRLTGNSSSSSASLSSPSSSLPLQLPRSGDLGECSFTSGMITDKIGGGVEKKSDSEVDPMFLYHEMCTWDLPPPPPLLPSHSPNSLFPSPNLYPDFYDFSMNPDSPNYYYGSSHPSNQ